MTETARLLEVDRRTIYRWRDSGYLTVKVQRVNKRPFVLGRQILKIFDIYN